MNPYVPQRLPLESLDWVRLIPLMGEANRQLARYSGVLNAIPNPDVFLAPLTLQEAVLSSRIEGTQETLEDVLRYEASAPTPPEKLPGIQEIINYRAATAFAVEEMQSRPLNLTLLKKMHLILMNSVRGRDKGRGEFRKTQVFIGARGGNIESATYVPPAPERVLEFLDNWEKYVHFDEKDRLAQLAIMHAQFEIIHPFLDGNGRIGRILIPLFLMENNLLDQPAFYISAYLETNRDAYIGGLNRITSQGDWTGWVEFFLSALSAQAQANLSTAQAIMALYERMKRRVADVTRSQYAIQAQDAIFRQPIFSTASFVESLGIPRRTAIDLLAKLKENGIVHTLEASAGRRPDVLAYTELLEIIE